MLNTELVNGLPEVTAENLSAYLAKNLTGAKDQVHLIDVRGSDEFIAELGHIEGATLVTLGPELQAYLEEGAEGKLKDEAIVFICRSGGRSAQATMFSQQLGYQKVYNMRGGMLRWNELQLPTTK